MSQEQTTTSMNISLPEALKHFVEEQVANGGYTSVSEYLRELIRGARKRQGQQERLESMLIDGLDSGPGVDATPEYWESKKTKLLARHRSENGPG